MVVSPLPEVLWGLWGLWDLCGRYSELATVLSDISGQAVKYREVDIDEGFMAVFGPAIRSGAFELQTGDLERVLGRPQSSLQEVVAGAVRHTTAD